MSLLRRLWGFLRGRLFRPEGREQRESKRILVRFAIAFAGPYKKGKGIARDLSLGGCMIETDTPLPMDTLLELKLFVAEHEMPVEVAASVGGRTASGWGSNFSASATQTASGSFSVLPCLRTPGRIREKTR